MIVSKKSKTKRFYQQSADAIKRFDERIPYYSTLAEAEEKKEKNTSPGGME